MSTTIGFIGQGFIGKNYADDFEARGHTVIRYGLEEAYRDNKEKIKECGIVFIAVPTPTTPEGFDSGIVKDSLSLVGTGKIAVIKSTMLPGTTVSLQKSYPDIIVLYSPEFLSVKTAAHDAANPFSNIVGFPEKTAAHEAAAEKVHAVLPKAPYSATCTSTEAELIKYTHNGNGYFEVILMNLMYDLGNTLGARWDVVKEALQHDPMVSSQYLDPVHKSGRGAGGACFIKDIAALRAFYAAQFPDDAEGVSVFKALEEKNKKLLKESGKDIDLLEGVYGQ